MINVTIWNEFVHENDPENKSSELYPEGIHKYIKSYLDTEEDINVIATGTLKDENCGITDEILEKTDVLIWWGHVAHHEVPDEIAKKVHNAVMAGMGMICLHSAHKSKPFMSLIGSTGDLQWRETDDKEILWVVKPSHPIAQGLDRYVIFDHEETYGEPFDIPNPDELVFMGWFEGGEVFRSGCVYNRGAGKLFYFQPGHETYPTYHIPEIQRIIKNGVHWAAPTYRAEELVCPKFEKLPF